MLDGVILGGRYRSVRLFGRISKRERAPGGR